MDPGFALLFGIQSLLQPDVALGDLRAFPPPAVVRRMLAVNDHARSLIGARKAIDKVNPNWWWDARCQAATAQQALDLLCRAQDADWGEQHRLVALRDLRSLLGWEWYYGGRLPPAVPLWAFPRCDDVPWNPVAEVPPSLRRGRLPGVAR